MIIYTPVLSTVARGIYHPSGDYFSPAPVYHPTLFSSTTGVMSAISTTPVSAIKASGTNSIEFLVGTVANTYYYPTVYTNANCYIAVGDPTAVWDLNPTYYCEAVAAGNVGTLMYNGFSAPAPPLPVYQTVNGYIYTTARLVSTRVGTHTHTAIALAYLEYSLDGGTTWVTIASTPAGRDTGVQTWSTALINGIYLPSLQIRLTVESDTNDLGQTVNAFADLYDFHVLAG